MSKRLRRLVGTLVAVGLMLGVVAVGASGAAARPPKKIGPVTGLTLSATKPGAAFRIAASWNPLALATKYAVRLSRGSTTLATATTTTTSWQVAANVPDGSTVTVTVTPYNRNRRGFSASESLVLPDLTAPVASYTVVRNADHPTNGEITLHQSALADNISAVANITQTVDWGDGTPPQSWPSTQSDITRVFSETPAVYYLTVTVTDEAGNARSYPLTVVVNDTEAPSGSFTVDRSSAWARWTKVTVGQTSLSDNLSAPSKIRRVVSWGDGVTSAWASGAVASHVYAVAGTFAPTVTITDEAGNHTDALPTSSIVVKVDSSPPVLRLTLPTTRKAYVGSWRTLRGRATDSGVGVRRVKIRAIEKRGSTWFGYRPASHSWAKGGTTKASGWRKARVGAVPTTIRHRWSMPLRGLSKGLLVYQAAAVDNVLNTSAWKSHQQLLTKR